METLGGCCCAWVDPMASLILIDRSCAGAEEKFDGTL